MITTPDWIIHGVFDNDNPDRGFVYHTHGLNKHDNRLELELNFPLNKKQAMQFINLIGLELINKNIIINEEYIDDCTIFNCPIHFKKVKGIYGDGEENIRIILPDPNMKFPWDEDCIEPYKSQI